MQPMALPYDEARRLIGVSEKTLRRWITAGELPVVEVGGVRLIRPNDLEEFLDSHKTRRNGAE
jgi:excisionase family DNA binding protein